MKLTGALWSHWSPRGLLNYTSSHAHAFLPRTRTREDKKCTNPTGFEVLFILESKSCYFFLLHLKFTLFTTQNLNKLAAILKYNKTHNLYGKFTINKIYMQRQWRIQVGGAQTCGMCPLPLLDVCPSLSLCFPLFYDPGSAPVPRSKKRKQLKGRCNIDNNQVIILTNYYLKTNLPYIYQSS